MSEKESSNSNHVETSSTSEEDVQYTPLSTCHAPCEDLLRLRAIVEHLEGELGGLKEVMNKQKELASKLLKKAKDDQGK